jgi:hypothetical protein
MILNFHIQKSLEIFDTSATEKSNAKITRGVKVPCLMPIRVKITHKSFGAII